MLKFFDPHSERFAKYDTLFHLTDQHASHCMGKLSESDVGFDRVRKFGFDNSESEPTERNCWFDHLSAKHFRFEDSAPEPLDRSVFAAPFRPYKGKKSDQYGDYFVRTFSIMRFEDVRLIAISKRFKIMEKLYTSKAFLKMAGRRIILLILPPCIHPWP